MIDCKGVMAKAAVWMSRQYFFTMLRPPGFSNEVGRLLCNATLYAADPNAQPGIAATEDIAASLKTRIDRAMKQERAGRAERRGCSQDGDDPR
ncbi:MAG: hypothetical protein AB1898_30850 [Acidobacteriota bacterium]